MGYCWNSLKTQYRVGCRTTAYLPLEVTPMDSCALCKKIYVFVDKSATIVSPAKTLAQII